MKTTASNNLLRVLPGLLLCAAAFASFGAIAPAEAPAPRRNAARFEVKFMKGMIDHHFMAVMAAELCSTKDVEPELAELCESIIAAQSAEIDQMQSWLKDWYGIEYEPEMTRRMERDLRELSELEGSEFEVAFMTMMIDHHEAAIEEAQRCLDRSYHEELENLCESIVEAQSREIETLATWLCEWHDLCAQ